MTSPCGSATESPVREHPVHPSFVIYVPQAKGGGDSLGGLHILAHALSGHLRRWDLQVSH